MAARAVGLATTGASLPPVASHASVAASAYHPPRGLLSIAASASRSPHPQGGCDTRCNFYHQAQFLLGQIQSKLKVAISLVFVA